MNVVYNILNSDTLVGDIVNGGVEVNSKNGIIAMSKSSDFDGIGKISSNKEFQMVA